MDRGLEFGTGGEDGAQRGAEALVEPVEGGRAAIEDRDVGAEAYGHLDGVLADDATAEYHDPGRADAGHAAHEEPGPALGGLEGVGAGLDRHAAGDRGHRRQERQVAGVVGDGLVGDARGAAGEQFVGLGPVGSQVQVGEERVVGAQHGRSAACGSLTLMIISAASKTSAADPAMVAPASL